LEIKLKSLDKVFHWGFVTLSDYPLKYNRHKLKCGWWITFEITIELENAPNGSKIESFLARDLGDKSLPFKITIWESNIDYVWPYKNITNLEIEITIEIENAPIGPKIEKNWIIFGKGPWW